MLMHQVLMHNARQNTLLIAEMVFVAHQVTHIAVVVEFVIISLQDARQNTLLIAETALVAHQVTHIAVVVEFVMISLRMYQQPLLKSPQAPQAYK